MGSIVRPCLSLCLSVCLSINKKKWQSRVAGQSQIHYCKKENPRRKWDWSRVPKTEPGALGLSKDQDGREIGLGTFGRKGLFVGIPWREIVKVKEATKNPSTPWPIQKLGMGMVAVAFNPTKWVAAAGISTWAQSQPALGQLRLHSEILSQKEVNLVG